MATFFKNQLIKEIGTSPVTAITTGASSQITVIGLSVSNLTTSAVKVNITVVDDLAVEVYYLKDTIIPAGLSLRPIVSGEKLILPADYSIKISADTATSLDATFSYVEIV